MDGIYGSYLSPSYDYNSSIYVNDPVVNYTVKVKKTYRFHVCENCGEQILKGSGMIKSVAIEKGKVYTYKRHLDC